jgi:KUP system potassium uptake protein
VALVLAFGSSSRLASAYGMAVTGTMLLTTLAFAAVARRVWGWRWRILAPILFVILIVDCAYFGSNLVKIVDGGYVPLVIGAGIFLVMDTWRWGRQWIGQVYQHRRMHGDYGMTVQQLVDNETRTTESGSSRSVVVMASRPISRPEDDVPPVLAVHIRNWKQVPKHVILLSVVQTGTPYARDEERYRTITFSRDTYGTVVAVHAHYGYMEQPNVREALAHLKATHQVKVPFEPSRWLILIGAERFVTKGHNVFERLRISMFSRMNRLAKPVTDHFGLAEDAGVTMETINI